ncbi:MAG: hypothetical protein ABIJ91_01845 [Candidatus Kuenenbacteria bacterium]
MPRIQLQNKKYHWTNHAKDKMRHYNLSESRLKRVFRFPDRREDGVAENTMACMQTAGSKKHTYEVWLMYQMKENIIKIISAWRYPGTSPVGGKIPVPQDIAEELGIR